MLLNEGRRGKSWRCKNHKIHGWDLRFNSRHRTRECEQTPYTENKGSWVRKPQKQEACMTEGFHLYYFKVFLCLTMRAVCPVQLKPSFQFSSGHSGLDQFSSIQFNSVCFTWKWLTPLTAGSHLLFISCAPTGLKLHHQPSPTGRQRSDVSVCVSLRERRARHRCV